jgi:hypothetical protein
VTSPAEDARRTALQRITREANGIRPAPAAKDFERRPNAAPPHLRREADELHRILLQENDREPEAMPKRGSFH